MLQNNLFFGRNSKHTDINKFSTQQKDTTPQKNFVYGLQNARNILKGLERSLRTTRRYERKLRQCQCSHSHPHTVDDWWEDDISEDKESKCSKAGTTKPSRSQVDLAQSWSTMSIVCLQYQYEELSKRYEALLRTYDERCSSLNAREAALARLRQHVRVTHAQLTQAHKTLLDVGEKYLALRERRMAQKTQFEEKIERLKVTVSDVLLVAKRARMDLDEQVASSMITEKDSTTSLLLAEIRKCNLLFLENLRLKARIEELAPGEVDWRTD